MSEGVWHYFKVKAIDGSPLPPHAEWVDEGDAPPSAADVQRGLQALHPRCAVKTSTRAAALGIGEA